MAWHWVLWGGHGYAHSLKLLCEGQLWGTLTRLGVLVLKKSLISRR
jgi:hypothetical protein